MGVDTGHYRKVATWQGWDYWQWDDGLYAIVPEGSEAPKGGYTSKRFILEKMGLPDMFSGGGSKKPAPGGR